MTGFFRLLVFAFFLTLALIACIGAVVAPPLGWIATAFLSAYFIQEYKKTSGVTFFRSIFVFKTVAIKDGYVRIIGYGAIVSFLLNALFTALRQ